VSAGPNRKLDVANPSRKESLTAMPCYPKSEPPASPRPLPPAVRVADLDVRMRPICCLQCWKTQHSHDVEQTEAGLRLVCACGLELLAIEW
jgi:hypothetical protein